MANLNLHSEKAISKLQDNGVDWAFYNNGSRWTYGIYMFKAVRNYNMKMRLSWHWNLVAGDPYYPLDCREDDYAWCNSSPDKELIPSLYFEREIREGLDDYRYIYTLWKLANLNHDLDALEMITEILDSFTLGETDIYKTFRKDYWKEYRSKMVKEIERLSSKDVARNVSTPNPGK
ncbi:MAG: hypothetical protein ACD_79C00953G0001 [uncultured bacterium]|nr:MAG: hypothetical protein ACD_79C00953G0001 [uncultured bacterium]